MFHELERRLAEITYVKCGDGLEIDFLARFPDGTTELIQVCADLSDPATCARELRAMEAAAPLHPHATRRLLVLNRDAIAGTTAPPGLTIESASDWILRS